MDTLATFGLPLNPFDAAPDPRFFCAAPSHADALALLEFAVAAGPRPAVVVGDSGLGKTLLGRVLVARCAAGRAVAWLNGGRRAAAAPDVTAFPVSPQQTDGRRTCTRMPLAAWRAARGAAPALLVIDDAHALGEPAWDEVGPLLAGESPGAAGLTTIALGRPELAELLRLAGAGEDDVPVGRLSPLTPPHLHTYLRTRLRAAGARRAELFAVDAVMALHELSRGVPGLVNPLALAALHAAAAAERTTVSEDEVRAAAEAAVCIAQRGIESPAPRGGPISRSSRVQTDALLPAAAPAPAQNRRLAATRATSVRSAIPGASERLGEHERSLERALSATRPPQERGAGADDATPRTAELTSATEATAEATALEERLRTIEQRLATALSRVRAANGARE